MRMERSRVQEDKFLEHSRVLFLTNYLTPYRAVMLNAWSASGGATIDVAETVSVGDMARGWGDVPASGQGWNVVGMPRARDIGRYDAIMLGGWDSRIDYWIALLAQVHRIPILLAIDGVAPSHRADGCRGPKSVPKRWLMTHAAAVLANGTIGRAYAESLGAGEERVFNQCLSVDTAFWTWNDLSERNAVRERMRSDLGIAGDQRLVLYAGRFAPEKRVGDLIKAVSLIKEPSVVLAAVGKGPEKLSLEQLACSLNVYCIFPGSKVPQELRAWYAAADVFALPSSEPWGLVVQEAMLSPLPVVVSRDAGCCADLVHDGVNGWTFECGDVSELAAGLERSLASPGPLADAGLAIAADWNYSRAGMSFANALHAAGIGGTWKR